MELLKIARVYLDRMKLIADKLKLVRDQLADDAVSLEYKEELYSLEFELCMDMTHTFEDISRVLDKLETTDEFVARRLRIQAESVLGGFDEFELG